MALIDELDKMSEEARLEAERAGCTVPQAVMPAGMGGHPGAAPAGHPGRPAGHPGHPTGAPAGGHPGHPGAITGGHHPGAAPGAAPGTKGGSSYRPGTSPQAKAYEERTGIKPPTIVAWEITRSCNLACAHCRAAAHLEPYPGELSLAECKAVIDDIASISDPILIVTGGEPLMRPDIWDIIAYAFEKGLHPVIGTNGTMIDDAMAKKIADAGVPKVSVSLDFPDAEGQDAFRGQKGAFDETVQGIKNLEKYGVHVQVNTTVTKANATKLDEIHNVSKELGATDFHPFLLVPTGRGEDLIDVELTPEEYDEVLTWAYHRQKTSCMAFKPTDAPQYFRIMRQQAASEGIRITPATHGRMAVSRGCLGGISFVFISHTGDVQPCGYFDMQLGNVKEQKFSDIWTNSPVFDDLRHYDRLKGKEPASTAGVCGGCRARALSVYGDYLETEPYCAYVPPKYARDLVLDTIQSGFPIVADPYVRSPTSWALRATRCAPRSRPSTAATWFIAWALPSTAASWATRAPSARWRCPAAAQNWSALPQSWGRSRRSPTTTAATTAITSGSRSSRARPKRRSASSNRFANGRASTRFSTCRRPRCTRSASISAVRARRRAPAWRRPRAPWPLRSPKASR